jgi:hypothetical protein
MDATNKLGPDQKSSDPRVLNLQNQRPSQSPKLKRRKWNAVNTRGCESQKRILLNGSTVRIGNGNGEGVGGGSGFGAGECGVIVAVIAGNTACQWYE